MAAKTTKPAGAQSPEAWLEIDTDREWQDIKGVLRLNPNVIAAVGARGTDAWLVGGAVLVVGGLAAAISTIFGMGGISLPVLLQAGLGTIIVWLVYLILVHLVARLVFGGQAAWSSFAKPMLYSLAITWLSVITALAFIAVWWVIVASYHVLRVAHHLPPRKAVAAIVIVFLITSAISAVLGFSSLFGA